MTDESDASFDGAADDAANDAILEACRYLRAHLTGLIGFDGEFVPIKLVVAPDGALVAPVMVAMLRSFDTALFLPDEGEDAMHMQVTLEEIGDRGEHAALCDRWRIYHGEPDDVRWARISIDAAKFRGLMFDGLALMRPNPLADIESKICRRVNSEMREALKAAIAAVAGLEVEDPRLVGVDSLGFDVRGRFDVVRLPADPPISDGDDAVDALEELAATAEEGDAESDAAEQD
ncbi:MAG: hypothetical protein GC172_07775 [Phycisphaera sp.]|nr:hypothetical protein [Phycisphaera sp.]